jgi:hypothetical protein
MAMEDELCFDTPPISLAASIFRTDAGWEFEVYQEDGDEFAAGTSPTIEGILDMIRDYLYAEYYGE